MSKVKINLRKQVQIIDGIEGINTKFLAIYKSKGKKFQEFHHVETLEEVKEIYNNWNRTLRPYENKRVFIKAFKVKPVFELTLIKE